MATIYVLKDHRGDTWRFTLAGKNLVTGEGDNAIVQSFPSAAAAKDHLEMVMSRRKRDGYALSEVNEVEDNAAQPVVDPLQGCVEWDAVRAHMKVTFKGNKVRPKRCEEIVARLEEQSPSSVELVCDFASPGSAFTDALAGKNLSSVKAFIFDTSFQTVTRQSENEIGNLADVLAAFPKVERAFVTGNLSLRKTKHGALRELYLLGDPLKAATVKALGACELPRLETLGLLMCSDGGPGPDKETAAALHSLTAPKLRTVRVKGLSDLVAFLDKLSSSPLPGSWSELFLSGQVDDEDALIGVLKKRAEVLEGLVQLGLPLSDEMSLDGAEEARGLFQAVTDNELEDDPFLPATYGDW